MSAPIGVGEEWRPVKGLEGHYEVSSRGYIRRARDMAHGQLPCGGLVQCKANNHGYPMFNTACAGRRINVALHLVVLRTFRGERPGNFHGAHLNGNRADARLENLAWVSPAANEAHKRLHGTDQRGERNPSAKLSTDDVSAIRASTENNRVLAERYGLNRFYVSDIRRGAVWNGGARRRNFRKLELGNV